MAVTSPIRKMTVWPRSWKVHLPQQHRVAQVQVGAVGSNLL